MQVINLDTVVSPDIFFLWEKQYKYSSLPEDKKYFLSRILNLDPKKENIQELKSIFLYILQKQNVDVEICDKDVVWLFNYFVSKFA